MTRPALPTRIGLLPAAAVGLLVVGAGIQFAVVRPRLEEVRRLQARYTELAQRVAQQDARDQEARALAGTAQGQALRTAPAGGRGTDPVAHIGGLMNRIGLRRLELAAGAGAADSSLESTRSTVRVMGSYGQILGFVRALEKGPPLASVDVVSIEVVPGESQLEGRLSISIYWPVAGRRR
ncbi:MAG: hypothetical protein HZB25_05955 [Candidatus Eisenbacteria bacterium]|nr:hypothetical protein [Candidatus Eisenbacteria bacterium]